MTDSLGRSWQLGTVQLDYNLPERFDLTYTGADNAEHRPVMIHRALFGSFERFIGILLEHYAGELPLWLAPVQAIVLPIADRHADYAHEVAARCAAAGLRAEVDDRTESVGRKIRDAELRKVPYMLVVGDREAEDARGRRCAATARATRDAWPIAEVAGARSTHGRVADARRCRAILRCVDHSVPPSSAAHCLTRAAPKHSLVPVPRRFDRQPPERDYHPDQRAHPRSRGPSHRRDGRSRWGS